MAAVNIYLGQGQSPSNNIKLGDPTVPSGITAALNVTEAADTLTASGSVLVAGALSVTEANDALSSSGQVIVGASASITEANDALTASGGPINAGVFAATEAPDALSAAGTVGSLGVITGVLNVVEASDILVAFGTTSQARDLGVRHRRYTASQWAQIQGSLQARRDRRREEEAKATLAKIAIAAIDEVEAPEPVKAPRKPLPLSTKARRKLREALVRPLPSPPIVALAVQTATVVQVQGPSFAERRAQLRAEWEAVLAAHEDAIEQEDEEAVVHLFMHMIGEE